MGLSYACLLFMPDIYVFVCVYVCVCLQMVWSVVKVFVDQRTKDKMALLSSSSRSHILEMLDQYVALERVPVAVWGQDTGAVADPLQHLALSSGNVSVSDSNS